MNISYKLALAFLPASLIPLGIAAATSYATARDGLEHQVKDHLQAIGAIQRSRLEALADRDRERLRLVAGGVELRLNLAKLAETGSETHRQAVTRNLREARNYSREFQALHVVNLGGRVVASTTPALVGSRLTPPPEARSERGAVDLRTKPPAGKLVTQLAGPILSGDRNLGALVIEASPAPLVAILGDYSGLGTTGETILAHKSGPGRASVLVPPRSAVATESAGIARGVADTVPVRAAVSGDRTFLADELDHRGKHVVAATQYLAEPGWGLVVKMDRDEAFAPVARLGNLLLLALALATVIGMVTSMFLAQAFSGPIGALTSAARRISEGEEPRRLDLHLERMPGPLADTLTRLRQRLGGSHLALQSRIEDGLEELGGLGHAPGEGPGEGPGPTVASTSRLLGKTVRLAWLLAGKQVVAAAEGAVAGIGRFEVDVRSRDEIGYLVEAFNRMAESVRDMRKQLECKIDELTYSNAELERFAYVASHDLQEPLRMISSYVQLLDERCQESLDPQAKEFAAFAVDGANRLQEMIEDLLEYSRVGTRGAPLEPMNSGLALEQALGNLGQLIREKGAVISTDPLPDVTADSAQLTRLFQNLLSNALKFIRPGVPPRIHVGVRRSDGDWVFSVQDNGIGIDPAYFPRIFQIFQRLHPHGRYPGTGIGLAISKRIVERHGGQIWVESRPGEGSTFIFTIPAAVRKPEEPEAGPLALEEGIKVSS